MPDIGDLDLLGAHETPLRSGQLALVHALSAERHAKWPVSPQVRLFDQRAMSLIAAA